MVDRLIDSESIDSTSYSLFLVIESESLIRYLLGCFTIFYFILNSFSCVDGLASVWGRADFWDSCFDACSRCLLMGNYDRLRIPWY